MTSRSSSYRPVTPITPSHSPHPSIASARSRTPGQLSLHEYRKLQASPSPSAVVGQRTVKKKVASLNLNQTELMQMAMAIPIPMPITMRSEIEFGSDIRFGRSHEWAASRATPVTNNAEQDAIRAITSDALKAEALYSSSYQYDGVTFDPSPPPSPSIYQPPTLLSSSSTSLPSLYSQPLPSYTTSISPVPDQREILPGRFIDSSLQSSPPRERHFKPIKRLPRPATGQHSGTFVTPTLSSLSTLSLPSLSELSPRTTSSLSLSKFNFPLPPALSQPVSREQELRREESDSRPESGVNKSQDLLQLDGTSFQLLNPSPHLRFSIESESTRSSPRNMSEPSRIIRAGAARGALTSRSRSFEFSNTRITHPSSIMEENSLEDPRLDLNHGTTEEMTSSRAHDSFYLSNFDSQSITEDSGDIPHGRQIHEVDYSEEVSGWADEQYRNSTISAIIENYHNTGENVPAPLNIRQSVGNPPSVPPPARPNVIPIRALFYHQDETASVERTTTYGDTNHLLDADADQQMMNIAAHIRQGLGIDGNQNPTALSNLPLGFAPTFDSSVLFHESARASTGSMGERSTENQDNEQDPGEDNSDQEWETIANTSRGDLSRTTTTVGEEFPFKDAQPEMPVLREPRHRVLVEDGSPTVQSPQSTILESPTHQRQVDSDEFGAVSWAQSSDPYGPPEMPRSYFSAMATPHHEVSYSNASSISPVPPAALRTRPSGVFTRATHNRGQAIDFTDRNEHELASPSMTSPMTTFPTTDRHNSWRSPAFAPEANLSADPNDEILSSSARTVSPLASVPLRSILRNADQDTPSTTRTSRAKTRQRFEGVDEDEDAITPVQPSSSTSNPFTTTATTTTTTHIFANDVNPFNNPRRAINNLQPRVEDNSHYDPQSRRHRRHRRRSVAAQTGLQNLHLVDRSSIVPPPPTQVGLRSSSLASSSNLTTMSRFLGHKNTGQRADSPTTTTSLVTGHQRPFADINDPHLHSLTDLESDDSTQSIESSRRTRFSLMYLLLCSIFPFLLPLYSCGSFDNLMVWTTGGKARGMLRSHKLAAMFIWFIEFAVIVMGVGIYAVEQRKKC